MSPPEPPSPSSSSSFSPSSDFAPSEASNISNMSSSLFINLTQPSTQIFPATELIKYLIEAIGHDVVAFRRNTQISYRLVDRVRNICDRINELIKKVDEEDSWDSYEKFTAAIDPLEELLFALTTFSEDESEKWLSEADTVPDCISATENWETNRQELRDTLLKLHNTKTFKDLFPEADADAEQEDIATAGKHDDNSLFAEILENIKESPLAANARGQVPTLITDVNTSFDNLQTMLQTKPITDLLTVLTIKSAMLVHGVMEVSEAEETDKEWTYHLRSENVWSAAKDLLTHMHDVDEDDAEDVKTLQEEYDEFLEILKKIPGVELPESYTQLMKHAGRIRRPYLARALALVKLCRKLADHFNDKARIAKNVYPLEDAFDETVVALKAAISAVTEIKAFDLETLETSPAADAFDAAKERIKDCFDQFEIASEWVDAEAALDAALETDRTRVTAMNAKLDSRPVLRPSDLVQVVVNVHEQTPAGRLVFTTSLGVEGTTRLRAIRWGVAKLLEPAESKRALTNSEFQQMEDGAFTPCNLYDAVDDLTETKTCELTLVLL